MPTIISHAIAGAAIAQALAPCSRLRQVTLVAAACAMLPDADALGFWTGVPYGSLFGHRGFTHSLLFSGLVAAGVASAWLTKADRSSRIRILACIFLATASHGFLDAFTNGGSGVAFFSPFDTTRYFFPLRPIRVAPISIAGIFTARGASVMLSEMTWVWPPAMIIGLSPHLIRCRNRFDSAKRPLP
jgi:inner membrane protein